MKKVLKVLLYLVNACNLYVTVVRVVLSTSRLVLLVSDLGLCSIITDYVISVVLVLYNNRIHFLVNKLHPDVWFLM